MSIRCFISVNLDLEVLKKVIAFQEKLAMEMKKAGCRVSWMPPGNMHLTLRFLGDIDENLPEAIKGALSRRLQGLAPFIVHAGGVGVFPGLDRPRVIWVGIEDTERRLQALQADMEGILADLGFMPEDKPFTAHLTLGRVRQEPPGAIRGILAGIQAPAFGQSEIRNVVIYRSDLKHTGAEYSVLQRITLNGGPRVTSPKPSVPPATDSAPPAPDSVGKSGSDGPGGDGPPEER